MGFFPAATTPLAARPVLYTPTGLQIWRAARGLADAAGGGVVPVVCLGDSVTWGQGSDNTLTTPNATAITNGWPGRLRALLNLSPVTAQQSDGEGYIFPNDSRVTPAGSPVQNLWAPTVFGQGYRLIGATQTLSLTVPTGVTSVGIIQGNMNAAFNAGGSGLADVTGQVNVNGAGFNPIVTLTNTNLPLTTFVAAAAGNSFVVEGPATAQTYISGFVFSTAAANGIQVHRVGLNGSVVASLLGGQSSGTLSQTAANQIIAARACYKWLPTPGLLIVMWALNDQQFQAGGGTASQNGVTLSLFSQWANQFAQQAVADGWCVLFVGEGRNAGFSPGNPTMDQYVGALQVIAGSNQTSMGFIDVADMWGTYANGQALGVQVTGSEHPNKAGALDVAAMVYEVLMNQMMAGVTSLARG